MTLHKSLLSVGLLLLIDKGFSKTSPKTNHGDVIADDMIFTKEQWAEMNANNQDYSDDTIIQLSVNYWDDGIIYYEMKNLAEWQQKRIRTSLDTLSQKTDQCLKFVERSNGPRIEVIEGSGCSSEVGRNVGRFKQTQKISLSDGCFDEGAIQHEFMHAVGISHTQTRLDRDNYVKIHWNNIRDRKEHNFYKYSHKMFSYHGLPYDYDSVMHYGGNYLGKYIGRSWKQMTTIETLNPAMQNKIGSRRLSKGDILLIKKMYNCTEDSAKRGVITSTNYPSEYPRNENRLYPLIGDIGSKISLTFTDFKLEGEDGFCGFDWVKVEDSIGGTLMKEACGTTNPGTKVFNTNHVVVVFHTDGDTQRSGFRAEWKQVN